MAFGPDYQRKVVTDPRNLDPLHLMASAVGEGVAGEGGVFDMLLGMGAANSREARENFSPYAQPATDLPTEAEANAERSKFAARQAAQAAREQQINEQDTEEGLLRRLIRPVNSFDRVGDELRQAPPSQR